MAAMIAGLYRLLKGRIFTPVDPNTSLEGKTVLITGGNRGLGLEAAIKYVNLGATTVIIGCRSTERGNQAKATIETLTRQKGVVQIWPLDMSRYDSVIAFARRVNEEIPRLDIALLNAGVLHRNYTLSSEGWEDTLQINTLSTILLALLLLQKLRASRTDVGGPANLTFTSSGTHKFVKGEQLVGSEDQSILQHVNAESNFSSIVQYKVSKILIEFAVKCIAKIARQENGTVDVIVNSACPGFCSTNLEREFDSFVHRLFGPIFYFIFGRSAEQGSRTLVSATLLGEESHGKFWTHDSFPDLSQFLISTEEGKRLQERAWTEIVEELKTRSPLIKELLQPS
ncbi:oxidoreductase,short chain dehydrogenase, putative [Coccidioides posadasii C735 delta SOWgp]|uniref:Oxidoreductase,short chain dehydrogenase, putative n=1 Tax=Coccidioides posadasii (strain C735) TaxID=222929 RepID=C5PAG6_COCP7|nr:oxidoreductase,short chain dehydrogenase, putative [Coccidioides posadasii C735 delta SOWgp]EER26728.1 oxidoreductase,short chain dehydrogenase, putative [Coccidioides posadasii C735 delta SOWgp]|eukprot:XP_003068873.1 oxidoreductase,short chain dehydrogenase, putative [Coccidioides posadasii C735 delta SOWgp]